MTTRGNLFVGALLIGGVVVGSAYRKGINDLLFSIDGFSAAPDGVNILVRIRVNNPSTYFGYPVPRMIVNAFDDTGSFIGTIINNQAQWIPAYAESFLYGLVAPRWDSLTAILVSVIESGHLPTGLVFHGEIQVGPVNIPFDTSQEIPALH